MTALDFYYDVPLPNGFSATVQILKTGNAIAALGHSFTFAAGPLSERPETILGALGLASPEPRLEIVTAFPSGNPGSRLHRLFSRSRLALAPPGRGGSVVLSRGESGFLVAPSLPRRTIFVYEMHRLAFLAEAERMAGERLPVDAPLPPSAARLKRLEARTVARADGLVFLTEAVAEAVLQLFPITVPFVIAPSGVEVPSEPPDRPKDVDFIFVGKIERRKGVDLALAALRHLPGRRLRLIGDGNLPWARGVAQDLGVADRVEFVGRLPHAAVAAALARAKVGLCPLPEEVDSVSERFTSPLKLLEMMAVGLPIVATDVASVRAVATHEREAILTAPTPGRIAEGLERLLAEPHLATRLGAAAHARAVGFAWPVRARTILNLANEVRAARDRP